MPLVVVCGLFGLIVGSFLNVVILRFGKESVGGRSACPSCGTALAWYDLVPIFSWLLLFGKCRYCGTRISVQYPLVEFGAAGMFALVGGANLPIVPTLISLAIVAFLIAIFVYDLYHKLIPDLWVYAFCILALAYAIFNFQFSIFILLAGFFAASPIFFLWALSYFFTGYFGAWMGFGDVKLALGIGWLLPQGTLFAIPLGVVAIFFSFIIGALISVVILLPLPYYVNSWHRLRGHALPTTAPISDHTNLDAGYTMRSEVPFGPFLTASCLIVWFSSLYGISIPFLI